jgi:O-antigen/teichoic acid export membrane protein
MGVISMLLSVQANVPQYVINHVLGASAVGVYALLSYPFMAGNIAVTAMGQAAAPQFANALERDDVSAFRRVLALAMSGGAVLGIAAVAGAWLLGEQLLRIVYSAEYAQYAALFTIIAAAAAVRYACLPVGVAITAQRRLAVQVWLRSATLVLAAVAVWAGAARAGLSGAAFALLCTGVVEGFVWVRLAAHGMTNAGTAPAPVPLPLT